MTGADYSYYASGWQSTPHFDVPLVSYDTNGNIERLQRRGNTNSASTLHDNLDYTYDTNQGRPNRLLAVDDDRGFHDWDAGDVPANKIDYDAVGNLTTFDAAPYDLSSIEYDERNLPISLTSGGTTVTYRYSLGGQHTYKQNGANDPEYYVLDGSATLAVVTGSTLDYWNVVRPDGTAIGRHTAGGGRRYYRTDHLGSMRAVIDPSGATLQQKVVETRDYYPFGLPMPGRITTEATPAKEDFTGHERDAETQLHYAGARYYMSALGRWTTTDPAVRGNPGLLENNPRLLTVSPYDYVLGNPVGLTDPTGEMPCCLPTLWTVKTYRAASKVVGSAISFAGESLGLRPGVANAPGLGDPTSGQSTSFGDLSTGEQAMLGLAIGAELFGAKGTRKIGTAVTNSIPKRMARVVPAEFADAPRLGPPGSNEAFVTGASDIANISTPQALAQKLTLVDESGNLIPGARAVIEFDTPKQGIASPVFRKNPGFIGGGRTAGGSREFVIPNFKISELDNVQIRIIE